MTPRNVLLMMRAWIKAELEKAKKPRAEPFVLTSLAYCAVRVFHPEEDWHKKDVSIPPAAEEALRLLCETAAVERQVGTYDVVDPHVGFFLIDRTLATLAH